MLFAEYYGVFVVVVFKVMMRQVSWCSLGGVRMVMNGFELVCGYMLI